MRRIAEIDVQSGCWEELLLLRKTNARPKLYVSMNQVVICCRCNGSPWDIAATQALVQTERRPAKENTGRPL